MNAADLNALGLAIGNAITAANQGQGKKVPQLESTNPIDWKTWRQRFQTIVTIAGWNDLRARRELFAAMTGSAAKIVADIAIEDPAGGVPAGAVARTLDLVLTDYEARFVTTEASDQAEADFELAQQMTDESLLEWHARLRDLYLRAFPGADLDVGPGGRTLRKRFTAGLDSKDVRIHVYDQRPDNYNDCLNHAMRKQATLLLEKGNEKKGKSSAHVAAIGKPRSTIGPNECYFCHGQGHFLSDCPKLATAKAVLAGRPGGSRPSSGQGQGQGRRSPWQPRSRPGPPQTGARGGPVPAKKKNLFGRQRKIGAMGVDEILEELPPLPDRRESAPQDETIQEEMGND